MICMHIFPYPWSPCRQSDPYPTPTYFSPPRTLYAATARNPCLPFVAVGREIPQRPPMHPPPNSTKVNRGSGLQWLRGVRGKKYLG